MSVRSDSFIPLIVGTGPPKFCREGRAPVAVACAGLSVLLHVTLIGAVLSGGTGRHVNVPYTPGVGTSALASSAAPAMTLIFLEEPGVRSSREEAPQEFTSPGRDFPNPFLLAVSPQPRIDSSHSLQDEDDVQTAVDAPSSNQLGQAELFGRYMYQIQARVERAWLRPRTPIGAELFECRVRIVQSRRGEVLEVELQECNGDARWQLSIVRAVEAASPLPAPPDAAVFTDLLGLSFRSVAHGAEGSEDGFESEMPSLAKETH
jgi:hypothetical protein